ncbi:hypothetical protein vseg_000563 [Gypsophila vaccaria]
MAMTCSNNNVNGNNTTFKCVPTQPVTDTTDVCDANSPLLATGDLRVLLPVFQSYGQRKAFSGRVVTVKTFEDNKVVVEAIFGKESLLKDDRAQVLVIDAGGSRRRSMIGSVLAQMAHNMGWAGIIVNGCIRDIDEINNIDIGIRALGPVPVRSTKIGGGQKHVTVEFAGVLIKDGDWICVDSSGIVVSNTELSVVGPIYKPIFHNQTRSYVHTMADYTSPVEPHRLFKAHCLNDHDFFPKFLPQFFEDIDFVEGDSTSVGCIKIIHFPTGNRFKYVKNRVDELDVDDLYIKYTTIEGDNLENKWHNITYEIEVKPSITGSHFKMIGYYEAKNDGLMPNEDDVKVGYEDFKSIHKAVQEFLLLYPHLYA